MRPKPGAKLSRRGQPRASARSRKATSRATAKKKKSASAGVSARKRTSAAKARPKRAKAIAKPAAKRTVRAVTKRRPGAGRIAATSRPRRTAPPRPRRAAATAMPPAPIPAAFSTQLAGASAREALLFELQRSRASVKAATQGLLGAHAERPIAPGKWCIKEIVLHLGERDRVRLEEFGRTLGGQPRTWAGISDADQAAVNEVHLAPLRAHTWDEAVRRMDSLREQLLHRLSQLPAQPDDVWKRGHAFGDMMWGLPEHDRHHAEQIKLARLGELIPVED